jgi:hypothetical protein
MFIKILYKIKANQNINKQFACLLVLISNPYATINNNYVTPMVSFMGEGNLSDWRKLQTD